jgi:hypothetical protein
MTILYPATLPQPTIVGLAATVAAGVIRAETGSHQEQRRVFKTMPHTFSLSFVMDLPDWDAWSRWVNENAFTWFLIWIPSLYSGRDGDTAGPVLLRFISGIPAAMVSGEHVQVSVRAEMAPSMLAQYLDNAP